MDDIEKLRGDLFKCAGTLNEILDMKDEKYTKWNMYHIAAKALNPAALHYFKELDELFHFATGLETETK